MVRLSQLVPSSTSIRLLTLQSDATPHTSTKRHPRQRRIPKPGTIVSDASTNETLRFRVDLGRCFRRLSYRARSITAGSTYTTCMAAAGKAELHLRKTTRTSSSLLERVVTTTDMKMAGTTLRSSRTLAKVSKVTWIL